MTDDIDLETGIILRPDGRQSQTALMIARGTRRLLSQMGLVSVPELSLASNRRADLVALGDDGTLWIVEIKSSIEDFRVDRKWPEYRDYCDHFFFAIPDSVPQSLIPEDTGLILADSYGAAILRDAPEHKLAAARRKAMLVRLARATASRLHRLSDPDFKIDSF
jgi:hypothetical protein